MRVPPLNFERSPRAIRQLDGIRAIAILLVLARHGVRPFVDDEGRLFEILGWDVAVPLLNGWVGVDLFFVLSGFLIAGSLLRQSGGGRRIPALGPYLQKRALRILPAYYVVLLLAVSGLVPHYDPGSEYMSLRVVYHLLFLQDYLPSNIVVAFWSLGVEEKFYLTAPLVWAAVSRLRSRRLRYSVVIGIISTGPLFRTFTYLGDPSITSYEAFFPALRSPFHMSVDPLYVGVLAAMIVADRDAHRWTRSSCAVDGLFIGSFGIAAWLVVTHELLAAPITLFDAALQPLLIAVAFGGVVLSVVLGGGPVRALGGSALFIVSKLSYALYLVHLLVIPATLVWLSAWEPFADLSALSRFAVFVMPYLVLSTALALVVYWLVELPALRSKARIDLRRRGDTAIPVEFRG